MRVQKALLILALGLAAMASRVYAMESGRAVGETVASFSPKHLSGPFKNTETCTTCRFGTAVVIQVWVTKDATGNIKALAERLEAFVKSNPKINACIIASSEDRKPDLAPITTEEVPITYLPYGEERVAKLYNIHAESRNTVLLYKNKKVHQNHVNVEAAALDKIFEAAKALVELGN